MNPDQYLPLAAKLAQRTHTPEEMEAITVFLRTTEKRHTDAFLQEYFRQVTSLSGYPAADPLLSARLSQLDLPLGDTSDTTTSAIPAPASTPPGDESAPRAPAPRSRLLQFRFLKYAAAVLGVVTMAAYLWRTGTPSIPDETAHITTTTAVPILPGGDRAMLALSDGTVIVLDSAAQGLVAMQGDARILKSGDGEIHYSSAASVNGELLMNTMSTPRGGQYRLTLPDGSVVWLNAASSLRFPVSFSGKERRVWLTGEAYFEVNRVGRPPYNKNADSNNIPFIIEINRPGIGATEIEVLGTHFNVNAYEDEAAIKTTLVEGKVRVSAGEAQLLLDPHEQAQVDISGNMTLDDKVDVEAATAWKNGYFSFNNTDVATLMRQICRWYDVEVEYPHGLPERKFGGEISRNSDLSQVLRIMEESELSFRVEGKKIIVLPSGAAR